ncbi:MAG: DUF1444 family protein [Burkholderiaceae bacterium]
MIFPKRSHILATALLVAIGGCAVAPDFAMDEQSFSAAASARVQREAGDYRISTKGSLILEGTRPDGESTGDLNLHNVYAFCKRNAGQCDAALDQYAKGIGEALKVRDFPIEKGMVRLAVRPVRYIEDAKKLAEKRGSAVFSRPVAPGLVAVPVLDYSRSLRLATGKDLPKLGLSEDELFKVGEENLKSTSRPFSAVTPVPGRDSFGAISGEDYAASRLLFHSDWRGLSEKFRGNLVVMVPTSDVLLYGDGAAPTSIEAIRVFGLEQARQSGRPLSAVLLRWVPTGWEVVN